MVAGNPPSYGHIRDGSCCVYYTKQEFLYIETPLQNHRILLYIIYIVYIYICSYHVHAFTIYDQLNYSGQMNTINTHFVGRVVSGLGALLLWMVENEPPVEENMRKSLGEIIPCLCMKNETTSQL